MVLQMLCASFDCMAAWLSTGSKGVVLWRRWSLRCLTNCSSEVTSIKSIIVTIFESIMFMAAAGGRGRTPSEDTRSLICCVFRF